MRRILNQAAHAAVPGPMDAKGATNGRALAMLLFPAGYVGAVGFGLGTGLAALLGLGLCNTAVGFRLPWQVIASTAAAILLICLVAALISIRKVLRLEPGVVFKG